MTSQYLSVWTGRLASSWLCGSQAAPPLSFHLLLLLLAISWLPSHLVEVLGFVKEVADGGSFLRSLMTTAAAIGLVYVEGRPERG